jgi:hypothetical protein
VQNKLALEDLHGSVPLRIPGRERLGELLQEFAGMTEEEAGKEEVGFAAGLYTDNAIVLVRGLCAAAP